MKQNQNTDMRQHSPTHPGKILMEFYLEPKKISITDASVMLQITRSRLSDIVNGKAGISANMAMKLSRLFNTSPIYWMNLQSIYNLWMLENKLKSKKQI